MVQADMNNDWIRFVLAIVGGGAIGAVVGLGLDAWLGEEEVALAALRSIGWFLLGIASGRWGSRVTGLRPFILGVALTGFTSWLLLLLRGPSNVGDVVVAVVELAIGLVFAAIGHLIAMPKGPDL